MTATKGSGLYSKRNAVKPHIGAGAQHAGALGEISALRNDLKAESSALAGIVVEEFTNPPTADVDAIKLAFATSITAKVFTGALLDGVVGLATMSPPRNATVTAAANVGGYTGNATIKGFFRGVAQTDTIAITDSATTAGTKPFDKVTEVDIPAQPDALGSISIGFGAVIGLEKNPKARAGFTTAIREIVDGAFVTTGTFSATNGTYAPATAPNGAHDYAVYYEGDFSLGRRPRSSATCSAREDRVSPGLIPFVPQVHQKASWVGMSIGSSVGDSTASITTFLGFLGRTGGLPGLEL